MPLLLFFYIHNLGLFRFFLFKTGAEEHIFHFNIHHIIADGTSLISIIEELWKLYKNKRAKKFHLEKQGRMLYNKRVINF